ncbi:transcription factor Jun [Phymastichus coffea]|uniref:transcription factor Jun n=1 Tax=Phymastichus coffea TaxID=108790 RepID=UPI00273C35C2|nr:transcription factor Jun [Phymastichus coffea]
MVRNTTMEPTFYEDQVGHFTYGNRIIAGGGGGAPVNNLVGIKRSNLTLDLNAGRQGPQAKRPKLGSLPATALAMSGLTPLLNSPDLLKLNSPEFDKLFIAQQENGMITTMPTPTTQMYFDKAITEEQKQYVQGFEDALDALHHSDSSQEPGSIHYTTLEPPGSVQSNESLMSGQGSLMQVKDEPQTVPSVSSSPPMSPIDMESQEKIKLERKRQRNRVAASKCRRRKLERISRLEDKVKLLKGENNDLSVIVNRLKEHVSRLKEQVIDHMQSGCQINTVPGIF